MLMSMSFALLAAATPSATPDPSQILARVKQATGGAAWDRIATTHTRVKLDVGGLKGTGDSWEDTHTGRSVNQYQLGPMSIGGGFDGLTAWSQDSSKQVRLEEAEEAQREAANNGYRSALGYFFPERWPAQLEYVGEKSEGDRRFQVVRATPKGGRPFDIWIDVATQRMDRAVEKTALDTRTTFLSDYREVQGVLLPFAARSTNGQAQYDQRVVTTAVEFNAPIDAARFAPPAPPAADFTIAGGTSTDLPFELLNNHIYVEVQLNGRGPFRVLCDTGGANIVTPELAAALGLKTEGAIQGQGVGEASQDVGLVKIESLQVGGATLKNQLFMVFALAPLTKVSGVPFDGLVGYEIFKRFVVTIDYEHGRMTLTQPEAFAYEGQGIVVPFRFKGHVPQVDGEIDGVAGRFDIDTGSRASISLLSPFVEKNGLTAKYAPKIEGVTGWGVGGPSRSQVTRAKLLKLGEVAIPDPVTELSLAKRGAFSDPYAAGNVGAGVLKRFNIIFDYGRQRLIFEPNGNYGKPDTFDRAGLWVNSVDGALEVMDVIAGAPAAEAGLKVGDLILAIDGRPAGEIAIPALRQRVRSDPPGTRVLLKVRSGNTERELVVTLRELV
jgi:hypothetical protein